MEKVCATLTENGKIKTVSVWLDERTAAALKQANNEELTRQYVIDEHRAKLAEYRETRRHRSLDRAMENGFDVVDGQCLEDDVLENIEAERLRKALRLLTKGQRELVREVFFRNERQKDIADRLGIDKTSVRDRLKTIYKKILKILEK